MLHLMRKYTEIFVYKEVTSNDDFIYFIIIWTFSCNSPTDLYALSKKQLDINYCYIIKVRGDAVLAWMDHVYGSSVQAQLLTHLVSGTQASEVLVL